MTLLKQIQTYLHDYTIQEVISKLGYKSSKNIKIIQTIHELLEITDINDYLDKSYYDFKYSSKTLLKAICKLAGVPKLVYAATIEEYEDKKRRLLALKQPYIFVDTDYKRKGEPIFALAALENKRRIILDKELYLSKTQEELNTYISNVVKLHYKWRNGKLPIWGNIRAYLYYDEQGNRTVYNTLGDAIKDEDAWETRANVTLKNTTLIGADNE
jgi:hypothetical protein